MKRNSYYLLKERYCQKGETPKDIYKRVAGALSLGDEKFEKKLHSAMEGGYFLPASPTIRNAGFKKSLLHPCMAKDTIIHTTEGDFTVEEMLKKDKKKYYVFCYDGKNIRIGKATKPFLTKNNAKVYKIKFKSLSNKKLNYDYIRLTEDHPIMMRDGSYKKVKNLKVNDRIMPFNYYYIGNRRNIFKGNFKNNWEPVYRLVYKEFKGEGICGNKYIIHHKDFNPKNDNPENLIKITKEEHYKIHSINNPMKLLKWKKYFSDRMKKFNPMNNIESRKKSGLAASIRMKTNNPMKNPKISKKAGKTLSKTLQKKYKDKNIILQCPICFKFFKSKTYSNRIYCSVKCFNKRFIKDKDLIYSNHKIESIEYDGVENVYDINVEKYHHFAANGIFIHNCHVLPIDDNIDSIMECLRNTAVIFHHGGGCGYNFSKLRPRGAELSMGGVSSGVVSFLEIFDKLTEVVKQGGFRRGASLCVLDYNHPEILDFIKSKLSGKLTNFNISVLVDDNFMSKVDTDEKIDLKFDGKTWNKIGAKDLFDLICFTAYVSGDPGLVFYDTVNKNNPLYPNVKIKACNPCFTGDTKIDTVYGKKSLKNLIGKSTIVYCYDGKKINLSKMSNIRKTGKNKEVWKITLDNGKTIKATPNHKFMLRDGSYKELRNLKINDSLMPFYKIKRNSKGYNQINLNNGSSIGEAQLVAEWKYGRKIKKGECIHHIDKNKKNNCPENLEIKTITKHNSEHTKKIVQKRLELAKNHKVKKIEFYGYEDVYCGTVEKYHNFVLDAGVIVSNCGEVPLPEWTSCNLGAINLSKLVVRGKFNFKKLEELVKLGIRTLRNINSIGWYPFPEMTKKMKELDPCGLGFMGFADCLIKLGIYYDSDEALKFIDDICKPYVEITNKLAKDSFYKRSQQPTGSLSILADCSSGIEPVFSRAFKRKLTIGTIEEVREIYKSKYCRTALEIKPEWHLKVQAKFQEHIDSAISKTVNLPNNATIDDIKNIYKNAWKMKCKGITVFRDGSKEGVLQQMKCDGDTCYL